MNSPPGEMTCLPLSVLHSAARKSAIRRTALKTKNAIITSNAPGLPDLKRMDNILRIASGILSEPVAPAHNRTDEQGRKQGYWTESVDGDVFEGPYVDGKEHGH